MGPELHHILEISENTKNSEFMNWMLKLGTVESPNTLIRLNEAKTGTIYPPFLVRVK